MSPPDTGVHLFDGTVPSGRRYRALCSCGYRTTPHATPARAATALRTEHGQSPPVCQLCGRDRPGHVELLHDERTGEQVLVCADDLDTCAAATARRIAESLDSGPAPDLVAALTAVAPTLPRPRPRLRVLPGGA